MAEEKLDLYKLLKAEYSAKKKPFIVDVSAGKFLTVEGAGAPGSEIFQDAIGALYSAAYTMKFAYKFSGKGDYKVCGLEGVYRTGDEDDLFGEGARDELNWVLMIRVPDFITKRELNAALKQLKEKGKAVKAVVGLEKRREGRCVQALHVGPYDAEKRTLDAMKEYAQAEGYEFSGRHHEIYISDPRRVPPERLKTILRIPVKKEKR